MPADSKLFGSSLFARFFTAGSRLVLLEMCQFALWLLTDEGMVTVLLRTSNIFLHVLKSRKLLVKALESGGNWVFCRSESQGWQ